MKNKIIFLDVDGVLNGYNFWNILGWEIVLLFKSERLRNWYRELSDPCGVHKNKVRRLAKIVRMTDARVVMSSTWRFSYWKYVNAESDGYDDIRKLAYLLYKNNIEVIGITPNSKDGRRDKEILSWLSQH